MLHSSVVCALFPATSTRSPRAALRSSSLASSAIAWRCEVRPGAVASAHAAEGRPFAADQDRPPGGVAELSFTPAHRYRAVAFPSSSRLRMEASATSCSCLGDLHTSLLRSEGRRGASLSPERPGRGWRRVVAGNRSSSASPCSAVGFGSSGASRRFPNRPMALARPMRGPSPRSPPVEVVRLSKIPRRSRARPTA